ncbi:MAG: hypothetical protein JXA87_02310, partial [Thermoleophilia bacterium]|nr:hypothetical protein [Thermoleophilia bacterium]
NRGSATFEIEVRFPPGQAVLRLAGATFEQIDLQLETGRAATGDDGSLTAVYDVWRTDPGPGVSYRRLATVTSDSAALTDTSVLPGETYRYIAVALSDQDVEGPPSESLLVQVPQAPASETTKPAEVSTTAATETGTTAKTTTSTEERTETDRDGLGTGAVVGIIIACLVVVAALLTGGMLALRKRRKW